MQNVEDVDKIFKIVNSSGIVEFEWERDGKKIFIKREESVNCHKKDNQPLEVQTSVDLVDEERTHLIKSPLVGTCYKVMVKLGDKIKTGDKLCFVEAMKVFKEIVSDKDGEIKEILVENGQSVMYGQPLFSIKYVQ